MKLGMDTWVLVQKFGEQKAFELLKQAGYDGIDYTCYHVQNILDGDYVAYGKKMRKILDDLGLECLQMHSEREASWEDPFDESSPRFKRTVRAIELASIMGAKYIVVHAVTLRDNMSMKDGVYDEEHIRQAHADFNYGYYKALEPYCAKFGVKVAVENIYSFVDSKERFFGIFDTAKSMNDFIERLNSPWICTCVDVGHAMLNGEKDTVKYIKGIKKENMQVMHIHDNFRKEDNHLLPFMGNLDYEGIINAIKEKEYKGNLVFEDYGPYLRLPNELVPDMLAYSVKLGRYLIKRLQG